MLSSQLGKSATSKQLGLKMSEKDLENLNEEQIGQLYELYQEIQNPSPIDDASDSQSNTKMK